MSGLNLQKARIDEVDRKILGLLSENGRRSNREIGNALGIGEGTVRSRIERMQERGIIKIMAVTSFSAQDSPVMAYIGVRADLHHVAETAQAIAKIKFVRFVASMLGRYDILVITLVKDGSELVRLVNEEIMTLPGVRHADTSLAVKGIKYDYRWGRIVEN